MNQQQIKELLENEEMEVNESLYLKQLIKMEQQTELQQILLMRVGDFLSYPNGEGALTEGQEAVGFTFNPSKLVEVDISKLLAAKLIDILMEDAKKKEQKKKDSIPSSTDIEGKEIKLNPFQYSLSWQTNVIKTEGFNAVVRASSAIVKFLTWSKI
jgi:hypothetical protein